MGSLRQLSVDQQVGLLFVIVFGLLALVTAWATFAALRRDEAEDSDRPRRVRRELRVAWTAAAVFWVSWVSGPAGATLLFVVISFLALREFITMAPTRRADHRSLVVAFFVALPMQYLLVAARAFDLFTVFIPVYVFLAIPVVGAFAGDPERFVERSAKIQWGLTVCVYGLSHAPAVLLLQFPGYADRGAFLVFFLVVVVVVAQLAQDAAARRLPSVPVATRIDVSFSLAAWGVGALAAGVVGAALYWTTPFKPPQALAIGLLAGAVGTLGGFVTKALRADAGERWWGGGDSAVTGAVGLLERVAPLCFAAPVFFHSVRWYFRLAV